MDKDRLDALDYEPILIEMSKENTFQKESFNLPIHTIASTINLHFGNLCYRAYYKEEGITKTAVEYGTTWGELLEALAERAETALDYINLASCAQMQFAAFEDRDDAEIFARTHYENAIERIDNVQELVNLVGGHLQEEYFEDEALATQAGEAALELAKTFQDYAYICFDENECCNFRNSDIYEQAGDRAIELKAQASEDELNNLGFQIVDSNLEKPWGAYFCIDENQAQDFSNKFFDGIDVDSLKIENKLSPKILIVKPNMRLSWQYHNRRAEIWQVYKGQVGVVQSDTDIENELKNYMPGDQIKLSQGERHRLVGLTDYGVVAEIWQHTDEIPSNEEDIIRVQDDFNR